jgi:predicted phosphodiesterase
MKILVLSDLHNEYKVFEPVKTDADLIVLAGDIDNGDAGILWARKTWPDHKIVYVIGNHEYYSRDYAETLVLLRQTALTRDIHLLENNDAVIDGVRFLGATLWTDFEYFGADQKAMAMEVGLHRLNDFKLIRFGELGAFTPALSVDLHNKSLAWLKCKLDEPFDGKTVLVTHHLPSSKSVPERFMNTPLSGCFVSNLDYLFGKMDLWIHGHTHDCCDYEANGTRVVCNPRGYITPKHGVENFDFDPAKVVEI